MTDLEGSYSIIEKLSFFKNAPVSKLWAITFLTLSIISIYTTSIMEYHIFPSYNELILEHFDMYKFIFSQLASTKFTVIIAQLLLIFSFRHIERRWGSLKFMSFIVWTAAVGFPVLLQLQNNYIKANIKSPDEQYLFGGAYLLIGAIYTQFLIEIPIINSLVLVFVPLSLHTLPLCQILQLMFTSVPTSLAILCGIASSCLFSIIQFKPHKLIPSFITNCWLVMFGYTLVDGLFEETFGGEHEVLPLACTVEKQRVEIQDAFENELIQREMNRVYDEQRRNPSNNPNDQLHFFNRRLNQQTNQNSNAVPLTQPSQENISIIREMGFADENLIKETLIRFNNDIVQSANFLLTNQNSQ